MTLREHFHLKKKESFSIDNRDDASVYFGGSTLNMRLRERLEDDLFDLGKYPSSASTVPSAQARPTL